MSDERTLRLERVFDAPVAEVFRAWVEPEQLVKWWGPDGVHIPEWTMDVREGGSFRTVMRGAQGDHVVSGVYRQVVLNEKLVFTWAWDQDDGSRGVETVVTITFKAEGDKTRLFLEQGSFSEPDFRDRHGEGWSSSFDCLATELGN